MATNAVQQQMKLPLGAARDFESLMDQSYRKVFETALRLAHNRQDAEDLTQEACFRAFRSFERFEGDRPFLNWMLRIVTRLYLDQIRLRSRRVREVSFESSRSDIDGSHRFDPADTRPTPKAELMSKTIDERLQDAFKGLPPQQQELVRMTDLEGLEGQEVAQLTSTPQGTVRSALFRAHGKMRTLLDSPQASRAPVTRGVPPPPHLIIGESWESTSLCELAHQIDAEVPGRL